MTKVIAEIEETELAGDYADVPGVTAECSRCGHTTESYGTDEPSVRRCLVLLRDECPLRERNYYVSK